MAVLAAILLTALAMTGDYFLKVASNEQKIYANWYFIIGTLIFALTAFGWVYVMRYLKLAEIGVIFSVSAIVMLAFIGLVFFKEKLSWQECAGVGMAIGSILLLSRFS